LESKSNVFLLFSAEARHETALPGGGQFLALRRGFLLALNCTAHLNFLLIVLNNFSIV